jgi:gluconolactonase
MNRQMVKASAFRYIRALTVGLMFLATSAHATSLAAEAEVVATGLHFPEGAIFIGETLYFVDYATSRVLRMDHEKVETVWYQDGCGANGLVALRGELLVACYDNGTIVRMTSDGSVQETITHDSTGGVFVRPNDLTAGAAGGVYFTGSGSELVLGKVYYRDATGQVTMVADGINYANGLAVANDGHLLYLAESKKHRLLTFEIGANGRLSHQAEFVQLGDILADGQHDVFTPDGVRLDKHGRLFVGLYDGGGFAVLTGDGKLIRKVELRGSHHASLAISPDGKSVFVTATDDTPDGSGRGEILKVDNPVVE